MPYTGEPDSMVNMTSFIAAIPWPVYPLAMLAFAVLMFIRNRKRYRRDFGDSPTIEDVRARYPRAKSIRLWKRR